MPLDDELVTRQVTVMPNAIAATESTVSENLASLCEQYAAEELTRGREPTHLGFGEWLAARGASLLNATTLLAAAYADIERANAPVSRCGCGRHFSAAEWLALGFVGVQEDGDGGRLELRNCACRSTLAVQLPRVD